MTHRLTDLSSTRPVGHIGRFARPLTYRIPISGIVTEPSLLVVCAAAFVAVLALLSVLAGTIRALTAIFPPQETSDPALLAAISAAAARAYPGMVVKSIQEKR